MSPWGDGASRGDVEARAAIQSDRRGGIGATQYERELEEELQAMRDLIGHMKLHSGYKKNGYVQMTTAQKDWYDRINYDGSLTLRDPAAFEATGQEGDKGL